MVYGDEKSDRVDGNRAVLKAFVGLGVEEWAFEFADAEHADETRSCLEVQGTPIGRDDILIAAQARRRGATLVTADRREFERVPSRTVSDRTA